MTDLLSRTGASRSSEHPVPRNRRRGPNRVWHDKAGRLAKYRIASTEAALYEDDLIPVCPGGDNASPLNHWPRPLGLERRLCAETSRSSVMGRPNQTDPFRPFDPAYDVEPPGRTPRKP